ncbi:transmembrane protein 183A [Plutella xylostella]|uniref:transmembrane protein 183A n=1 Tax=Plutella xylostella TaxID=51655 RepID=UPI0020330041|nr:transmembrane protein 183A [Plutella xylostella]
MPKKKNQCRLNTGDFSINDSANAPKPVSRVKKSTTVENVPPELSWDEIPDDDFDIVEEVNSDGTKNFVYKKKKRSTKCEQENIEDRPGIEYPEIVWYLISKYIKPEDIGRFAGINKATYAITKRESFWRELYSTYCEYSRSLPTSLRLENSFKYYGLRQRVIRALHYTYDVFTKRVVVLSAHDSRPHELVRRRCVNVWYLKCNSYWVVYFKFKKIHPLQKNESSIAADFIEELGRIDANPEEDSKVLQVTSINFCQVPPLMGMTLSSVSVVLSPGFRHHRMQLGFNSGVHNISRDILPECSVVLDTVLKIAVHDWWNPKYPYFDNQLPARDEESKPVLKESFFTSCDTDLG